MILARTTNTNPDFALLVSELDADLWQRYPSQQSEYDQHNVIAPIETALVGYVGAEPMACGCFKVIDAETVEIKRMYIRPHYRRRGHSTRLITELESWAKELGYSYARLECGAAQPEALAMYSKIGYKITEKFGPYVNFDSSVCFRKALRT